MANKILKFKEVEGQDLVDFVNKYKISKEDIQQITSDKYGDRIFYWGDTLVSGGDE